MDMKNATREDLTVQKGLSSFRRFLIGAGLIAMVALILLLVGFGVLMSRGPKSGRTMRFLSKVSIPATRGFFSATDYATVRDGTLYVAYGSADSLLAIDTRTQGIRTFAAGMYGVHGVAFSGDPALAFASLGGKGTVAVIGMGNPSTRALVPAGREPDGIVFDRHADLAYVGNNRGGRQR